MPPPVVVAARGGDLDDVPPAGVTPLVLAIAASATPFGLVIVMGGALAAGA